MIEYKIITDTESKQNLKSNFQNFFRSIYNQELTDENWEHQFIHSPYENSALFLAFDGEKIVGSALMIPQKFATFSSSGLYYLWTTSAIDKEYRSQGLYAEILKMQREYSLQTKKDFIFAFPNKLAYPVVKLFGGFKDLYRVALVKANINDLDLDNIKNSLVIDKSYFEWRFEHKEYLFYNIDNCIIIAKKFENSLDILAVYNQSDLNGIALAVESSTIPNDIIVMQTFLKEDCESTVIDKLSGTYFPINKEIDYSEIKLNLLMSDVF